MLIGRDSALKFWRFVFWFNVALLGLLVTVASLHRSHSGIRELLVEYRNGMTTHKSSDLALFGLNSSALVERGYLTDSADVIADWRPLLTAAAPVPGDVLPTDDISKVEAVVNSFSRGGGERPIYFLPLLQRIAASQRASGYCSDHIKIFIALAHVYGVFAREIQNDVHGFADFFSTSRNKWIFVDPMYAVLATDGAGTYLSSLELRERRLSDLPVHFVFFGVSDGVHSEADPRFKLLYDRSNFTRYVLTYGNNVLTEASQSARLAWLPWEARQLILYTTRMKPIFVHLADSHVGHQEVSSGRLWALASYGLLGYFAVSLTAYPLLLLWNRIERLNGRRTETAAPNESLSGAAGMGSASNETRCGTSAS